MAILAFSLTMVRTIGTLIGTGRKVGIVALNKENHQSEIEWASIQDLVATSVGLLQRNFKRNDVC